MRIALGDLTDTVAFCDPAGGKHRLAKQRARSAICVISRAPTGHVIVRHIWMEAATTDQMTEEIFSVHARFQPSPFGVEADAMQSLYGDAVAREARQRGIRLNLVPVHQPKHLDKDFRIRARLQRIIASGRLVLPAGADLLWEEITGFPHLPLKDGIDSLASAVSIMPVRPIAAAQVDDRAALAGYLEATGVPEDRRRQRLKEWGQDYPSR